MNPGAPALIGAVEASRRLGVSRKTVNRWAKSGILKPATRLPSGVYRFDPSEVERVKDQIRVI